jgi:hypothetical protein
MRAVRRSECADSLAVSEVEEPLPGPDEPLVRVLAPGAGLGVISSCTDAVAAFVARTPRTRARGGPLVAAATQPGSWSVVDPPSHGHHRRRGRVTGEGSAASWSHG